MKNKFAIILGSIIVVVVTIVVIVMMNGSSKPAVYEIKGGELVITGSFGVSVPLDDIASLELTQAAPDIATRTNGAGIGSMYKGEFKLADGRKARLYIDDEISPFIRFIQGDTVFYLNSGSPESTQALFEEIQAALR